MAAQFFSSLADNALLVAAIALLIQAEAPSWLTPYLKFFFVISYVALAPFVGAFADRLPKGQVMLIANTIKIVGCLTMLWGVDPLIAYAIVGLGAAAYSPAKYGILTEYLPHRQLVVANGWIEGLTVASIILGTMLGGMLIHVRVSNVLLHFDMPLIETSIDTAAEAAIALIVVVYAIAALFNLEVPKTGVALKKLPSRPDGYAQGLLALRRPPVARPPRPDLARGHHALLGRGRDAAVHRHRVGARRARLRPFQGRDPAGRERVRHRPRRGARLGLGGARPLGARDPARHRHGHRSSSR